MTTAGARRPLRALRAILPENALFVFDHPYIASFEASVPRGHWWGPDLSRHTPHFAPNLAASLARASGFRVEWPIRIAKSRFHMGFLRPPTWDGVPRDSPLAAGINAAAPFRALRFRPHDIFAFQRTDQR